MLLISFIRSVNLISFPQVKINALKGKVFSKMEMIYNLCKWFKIIQFNQHLNPLLTKLSAAILDLGMYAVLESILDCSVCQNFVWWTSPTYNLLALDLDLNLSGKKLQIEHTWPMWSSFSLKRLWLSILTGPKYRVFKFKTATAKWNGVVYGGHLRKKNVITWCTSSLIATRFHKNTPKSRCFIAYLWKSFSHQYFKSISDRIL